MREVWGNTLTHRRGTGMAQPEQHILHNLSFSVNLLSWRD